MFCTGAAPTRPGISARFSSPGQPCCSVQATKSCQFSPAPASTMKASGVSRTRRRPGISTFSTTAATSRVSTRLLPPPRISFFAGPNSGWSTTRLTSASLRRRTSAAATAGSPKLLNARRLARRSN